MVTKSAMTVASKIVCPNKLWHSPASLRIGTTTPNAVVERINAIIHGSVVAPIHCKPQANTPANSKVAPKLRAARASGLHCDGCRDVWGSVPRRLRKSISMPERNIRKTKPNSFSRVSAPLSDGTQPNPLPPRTMPPTISPTTIGIASRPRTDERSSGITNASMTTISNGANERASSMKTS